MNEVKSQKIKRIVTPAGNITIPVTRTDNALCLRFHLATATDSKKRKWNISHSGGAIVIDVPEKHRDYSVSFEDILREIVLKEENET